MAATSADTTSLTGRPANPPRVASGSPTPGATRPTNPEDPMDTEPQPGDEEITADDVDGLCGHGCTCPTY